MNKNIKTLMTGLILCFSVINCTDDFEEINTNPNAPETVTPDLLLSGVERDVMTSVLNEAWGIGNTVVQHTAKNQFVNEDRYLWGELNGIWNAVYDNMRDVESLIQLASEKEQSNYVGVGMILRAWIFSLGTDCYGDIPYSEAIKARTEGIYYPKYDSQEDIYTGILADLEEANSTLADASNIKGDLIYGGNVKQWRKLANALRIRYLMRISDRVSVGDKITAIINDPTTNPLFEGDASNWNVDNAVYTFLANSPDQFPLFSSRIGSFNEFRASKTLMDELIGMNDPRYKVFFRPTPATEATASTADDVYVGIPNGMADVEALEYNGGPQFQSRIGALFYESSNSDAGRKIAKGVVMTSAELYFLLAEARERGIITVGDAEAYYLKGINASLQFYGQTVDASYFSQDKVAYTGTQDEKLEKIGTQKWIALFYQGLEAWFDWRRTGYPTLLPGIDNQNEDRIPVRFIYPIIEQSLNGNSRSQAVTRQGADDINTRVWWDVD
jgi:hypothetical protein